MYEESERTKDGEVMKALCESPLMSKTSDEKRKYHLKNMEQLEEELAIRIHNLEILKSQNLEKKLEVLTYKVGPGPAFEKNRRRVGPDLNLGL
ncbi:unnamed protein product [Didymodactylos carnosus]|uniref:Uncharacterized protein n=1 Tax=Didymodactylos carnosus TaxID=1234261 RepID=A0A8S2TFR1_9BILA|nr:unnamed protein product [Didymodactylos carnosus]